MRIGYYIHYYVRHSHGRRVRKSPPPPSPPPSSYSRHRDNSAISFTLYRINYIYTHNKRYIGTYTFKHTHTHLYIIYVSRYTGWNRKNRHRYCRSVRIRVVL